MGGTGPRARRRAELGEDEPAARINWELVGKVIRLARPFWPWILTFAFASVTFSIVSVAPPLLFREVIDKAIPRQDLRLLTQLSLGAIGLVLLRSLLSLLQRWSSAKVGSSLVYALRTEVHDHVQRMPPPFFIRSQTGALLSRINNDVQGAQQVLTEIVSTLTSNVVQLAAVVTVMVVLEWRLSTLVLVVVPAFLVITKRWGRVVQRLTRERLDASASMNSLSTERLNAAGIQLVHLYGDFDREQAEFEGRAGEVRRLMIRTSLVAGVAALLMGLVTSVSTALVYGVGGWLAITGAITPGTVVLFVSYADRVYRPLNSLTTARVDLMTATVAFERVFEVLDFVNRVADRPGAQVLVRPSVGDGGVRGLSVAFEGVGFVYPTAGEATLESLELPGRLAAARGASRVLGPVGGVAVLSDVSFVAGAGEMVALVGPTGAGKSTLVSLVPRLYDVTAGRVLVGGVDVRDLTLASLRAAVGVVSQDVHLFHDTVGANLRYAAPDASDEEVEAACRVARIHEVIAALPEGYETVAGERGYRLSGGEKQRVAIARMILKDPAVVVMDEATSHLDSENERLIKEALEEALVGRTSLVIAHRLSTVLAADRILVLEAGRIVQSGTHEQLVEVDGLYRRLYQTQFRLEARTGSEIPPDPAGSRGQYEGGAQPRPAREVRR